MASRLEHVWAEIGARLVSISAEVSLATHEYVSMDAPNMRSRVRFIQQQALGLFRLLDESRAIEQKGKAPPPEASAEPPSLNFDFEDSPPAGK